MTREGDRMPFVRPILCGVLALLVLATSAAAHHSAAAFDTTREVSLKGTVVMWRWTNPHCLMTFDVTDDSGKVTRWTAETSNPTDMGRRGWVRNSVKTGDVVTVALQPARNGAPLGRILHVTHADGQVLRAYGAPPRGQAPPPPAQP